jgi:NAD(P)-dependent dehydrogenase (short-subunit alcohol dehydrogenase family)
MHRLLRSACSKGSVGGPQWRHEGAKRPPESNRRLGVVRRIGVVSWGPGRLALSGVRGRDFLMFMSVLTHPFALTGAPELAGSRVLITGLTSGLGFEIARAFADHGARLVVQSPEDSPEITELASLLAENSSEMRLFSYPLESEAEAVRIVQGAVKDFGTFDVAINLASVDTEAVAGVETAEEADALVADALRLPFRLTEVVANRMRLTHAEGSILTIVRGAEAVRGPGLMLADVMRAELQDMTRGLAAQWAEAGIRVNAVGPVSSVAAMDGAAVASEADLAAVALQLASRKGRSVSGYVLDAAGAARRWC